MRTTLKRGIGRGATVNGNGRAILPPGPYTPVRIYRQPLPEYGGWRVAGRVAAWAGAIVLMLAGGIAGGVYLWLHHTLQAVAPQTKADKRATEQLAGATDPSKPAVALVIGYDRRFGETDGSRSDTIMLVRTQADPPAVSILSFPRDLAVNVTCPDRFVGRQKINAAYAYCGSPGSMSTIKELTGLPINYLITVNFRGFTQVVDKLGGIWIDVDRRYFHSNSGTSPGSFDRYSEINLQPGYQRLSGSQALAFVRYRHTDDDTYRNARQQLFLKAVRQQISKASLTDLPRILHAVVSNIVIGRKGGGAPSDQTMFNYGQFLYGMPKGNIFQVKIDGITNSYDPGLGDVVEPNEGAIRAAVNEFQHPDVKAAENTGSVVLHKRIGAKSNAPKPWQTTVSVMNANGIAGSAGLAVDGLDRLGYKILYPPNEIPADAPQGTCPRQYCFKTQIFWNPAKKRSKAAATKIGGLFGQAEVQKLPERLKNFTNGSMVVVGVGTTFHGSLAPAPVEHPPKKTPPRGRLQRGRDAEPSPAQAAQGAVQARSADAPRGQLRARHRGYADPHLQDRRRRPRRPAQFCLPERRLHRVLGSGGDQLDGRAGTVRREFRPNDQGEALPLLLERLGPAHDRPVRKRRDLLGREHAARLALPVDDDGDRQGSEAAGPGQEMSGSRIAVFGAGYAGLVTGACFAELGHSVTIRDIVPAKIEALNAGEVPIYEPGLKELIQRNRDRLAFTLDPAAAVEGSQFVFICVDTPPTYAGDADLSRVWTVIEELPPASERMILVMKSTVPVGTGETVRANLDARGFEHVGYVSNPEFLAEGTAVKDFLEPDRVVVGAFEDADAAAVEQLHAGLNAPVVRTDVASAEMIKLASNAFLGTRISFINEIANVCELVGADVNDVARGMGLDSRIGTGYLKPGIGFGGSCFPKDISFLKLLAGNSGYHFQLLNSVIEVNELQKRRVIGKLQKHLGSLRGRCIALLGLAFKAHTDDLREAPSIVLASRLLAEGADVRAWDPVADASQVLRGVSFASTVDEAVAGADAAVIVTEWDELRTLASPETHAAMRIPLIIDGRNLLDPDAVRAAGFAYEGIGRPTSPLDMLPETAEPQVPAPARED